MFQYNRPSSGEKLQIIQKEGKWIFVFLKKITSLQALLLLRFVMLYKNLIEHGLGYVIINASDNVVYCYKIHFSF